MVSAVLDELNVCGACAKLPMNGTTSYPVIELPPLFEGADQDTDALWLPGEAVTFVGARSLAGVPAGAEGATQFIVMVTLDSDGGT